MKKNLNEKTKLIQDSALQGVAELQTKGFLLANRIAQIPERVKTFIIFAGAASMIGLNSTIAWASGGNDCGGDAGTTLVNFISDISKFIMIIGGALAILMFVVGAVYIIGGSKQSNVTKGIGFIKNAAIGLGVLILVFFLREIVVNLGEGLGRENADSDCVNQASDGF
jgi:hypothetical protein